MGHIGLKAQDVAIGRNDGIGTTSRRKMIEYHGKMERCQWTHLQENLQQLCLHGLMLA